MDELGTITINAGAGDVEINLDEYLLVDENNLAVEFARHSAKYAYLAILCAGAEASYIAAKEAVSRAEKQGLLDAKTSGIKVTDTVAEAMAELSCSELRDYEVACRAQYLLMKAVVDAMSSRKDMLISLGAHLRAEQDTTGMTVRHTDVGAAARDILDTMHRR
jgi:hypothetical protein